MSRRSENGTRASWQVRALRRQRRLRIEVHPVDCRGGTGPEGSAASPRPGPGHVRPSNGAPLRTEQGTPVTGSARGRVAAIDCGTNSTRLLVANADGTTHLRLMRITRLGAGVDATGDLDAAA